ncbi:MAG TPA: sulfite exporter TauE/SafE family protein [Spirochaetia bacterium]|nr:sulfite exporter TauE/SafE family protein [Spirochaetia bacterium]
MEYVILILVTFISSLVHGATGFGFAIIAAPLLSFFIPVKKTIAVVLILILLFTLQMTFRLRKHINLRLIALPLGASMVGRIIGVFFLMHIDVNIFRLMWGIILILFSVYFAFFNQRIRIRPTIANGLVAGGLSGLVGGMFNTGGPPMVIYFFSCGTNKQEYSAALQFSFAVGSMVNFVMHIIYGNIDGYVLRFVAVALTAALAGSWIGLHLFEKISKELLIRLIYALMVVMGVMQVVKALTSAG